MPCKSGKCADKCEKKNGSQLAQTMLRATILALRAIGGDTNDKIVAVLELLLIAFCSDKCASAAEGPTGGAVAVVDARGLTINFGPDNAYTFTLPLDNDAARQAFATELLQAAGQLNEPLPPQGSAQLPLPFHS